MLAGTTIYLVTVFSLALYFYIKHLYSYWDRRGVKCLKPSFPFGNYGNCFRQKVCIGLQLNEFYRRTNEPFIGVFGAFRPILLIRDPELIRQILIKDFQYFANRGVYYDHTRKTDPLSAHLFAIDFIEWKNWRVKLSPAFTPGKLKAMFPTIRSCTDQMRKFIENAAENGQSIEVREMAACYTTDVTASVAFGLEIDSFANPNTGFRKYGRKFLEPTFKNGLRFAAMFVCPQIMKWFKIRIVDRDIQDFMIDTVKENMEYREMNDIVRKDFFQLLVQLRNTGEVNQGDEWKTIIAKDEDGKQFNLEDLTAQAFVFFVAGFETSSSLLSFLLYELAKDQYIQKQVHREIDELLVKYNGELTYEALGEMKYLECCLDETLRKYPSLPLLNREVTKPYQIPGTDITLKKGTAIKIPMYALHQDEKYFPNPAKFDPSRFFDENCIGKSFAEMPFFPFGDGPRNCIGMRLGRLQSKIGAVFILKDYNFTLADIQEGNGIEFSPKHPVLAPVGGIHLKVEKR